MDAADEKLKALFAMDEPPARDHAFQAAVMHKVMRRRFQEDVALLGVVTLVGGVSLWGLWPVVHPVLVDLSQGLAPAVAVVAMLACAGVIVAGRAGALLGAES